ncbi:hypothetical protein [Brevundimonas sp.]
MHIRAEKGGIVELATGQVAAVQIGGGEVGVGEIATPQVEAREVHPGKDGPGAAEARLPQAIVTRANGVDLLLADAASGDAFLDR